MRYSGVGGACTGPWLGQGRAWLDPYIGTDVHDWAGTTVTLLCSSTTWKTKGGRRGPGVAPAHPSEQTPGGDPGCRGASERKHRRSDAAACASKSEPVYTGRFLADRIAFATIIAYASNSPTTPRPSAIAGCSTEDGYLGQSLGIHRQGRAQIGGIPAPVRTPGRLFSLYTCPG